MAEHRFWRIARMESDGGWRVVSFRSINVLGPGQSDLWFPWDIGTNVTITSSHGAGIEGSAGPEAYADIRLNYDDVPSEPTAPWVQFEFASPVEVAFLRFITASTTAGAAERPTAVELHGSDDGVNWPTQLYIDFAAAASLATGTLTTYTVAAVESTGASYKIEGLLRLNGSPSAGVVIVVDTAGAGTVAIAGSDGVFSVPCADNVPRTVIAAADPSGNAQVYANVTPVPA